MKKFLKQIFQFLGLSGIGWLLDFAVYSTLTFLHVPVFVSNLCSSFVGASFVFVFSTRFVFQHNSKIPLFVKYFFYIAYQIILIYLMSRLLTIVNGMILQYLPWNWVLAIAPLISKMAITPISMALNFIVMKTLIEKI